MIPQTLFSPTIATWPQQRDRILAAMQLVMGELPAASRRVRQEVRVLGEEVLPAFTRRKIEFLVEANDWLPAYLLLPHQESAAPGVLCLHQTTRCGKAEPAGVEGKPSLHYAAHLAARGYVALAPDYPFHPDGHGYGDYYFNPYENGYASATMKGIWNHMRAVDVLQSLPAVDAARIGCIGHSLGGHNTLFVAAFDERIKAAISCCGFSSFATYRNGNLADWSHPGYMPRIAAVFQSEARQMPFDFPEVVAALAPRAFLAVAPLHDDNFEVSGARACLELAQPIYEMLGAAEKIQSLYPDCGHDFPDDARQKAYAWFDYWLKAGLTRRG
jgi:dienelactone hydrolase